MKKIAFGIACGLTVLYVLAMMLTLYGRNVRQKETTIMLTQAMDTALSRAMAENADVKKEDSDFTADFLKSLLIQANSESELTVSILDADYRLGILSAEVTEKFKHPNGREGTVSEVRTVIYDRAQEEKEEFKTVTFFAEGKIYKEYRVREKAVCPAPLPPKQEGKTFRRWLFESGDMGEAESLYVTDENGGRNVLASGGSPWAVSEDMKLIAEFYEEG